MGEGVDDFSVRDIEEAGQSLVRHLLGRAGWDDPVARDVQLNDCDGEVEEFMEAVLDLKAKLESDIVHADTDSGILRLARMFDQPWARFVDPELSRPQASPTSGSLIVLWECSDHSIGLHDKGKAKWSVVNGMKEIEDLYEFLELGDEDVVDEREQEIVELASPTQFLSGEDLERRELLDEGRRRVLEQNQEE